MESTISLRQAASLPEKHPSFSPPGFREWAGFILILLAGAALRLWNIGQNGTGNSYYAAAVRSMMMNWHNFFFVSFDPVGFVTVDKPPVALWIQTAFAKLFGYRGFTLILPQVLEGLGTIILGLPSGAPSFRCRRGAFRGPGHGPFPRERGGGPLQQHGRLPGPGIAPCGLGPQPGG